MNLHSSVSITNIEQGLYKSIKKLRNDKTPLHLREDLYLSALKHARDFIQKKQPNLKNGFDERREYFKDAKRYTEISFITKPCQSDPIKVISSILENRYLSQIQSHINSIGPVAIKLKSNKYVVVIFAGFFPPEVSIRKFLSYFPNIRTMDQPATNFDHLIRLINKFRRMIKYNDFEALSTQPKNDSCKQVEFNTSSYASKRSAELFCWLFTDSKFIDLITEMWSDFSYSKEKDDLGHKLALHFYRNDEEYVYEVHLEIPKDNESDLKSNAVLERNIDLNKFIEDNNEMKDDKADDILNIIKEINEPDESKDIIESPINELKDNDSQLQNPTNEDVSLDNSKKNEFLDKNKDIINQPPESDNVIDQQAEPNDEKELLNDINNQQETTSLNDKEDNNLHVYEETPYLKSNETVPLDDSRENEFLGVVRDIPNQIQEEYIKEPTLEDNKENDLLNEINDVVNQLQQPTNEEKSLENNKENEELNEIKDTVNQLPQEANENTLLNDKKEEILNEIDDALNKLQQPIQEDTPLNDNKENELLNEINDAIKQLQQPTNENTSLENQKEELFNEIKDVANQLPQEDNENAQANNNNDNGLTEKQKSSLMDLLNDVDNISNSLSNESFENIKDEIISQDIDQDKLPRGSQNDLLNAENDVVEDVDQNPPRAVLIDDADNDNSSSTIFIRPSDEDFTQLDESSHVIKDVSFSSDDENNLDDSYLNENSSLHSSVARIASDVLFVPEEEKVLSSTSNDEANKEAELKEKKGSQKIIRKSHKASPTLKGQRLTKTKLDTLKKKAPIKKVPADVNSPSHD